MKWDLSTLTIQDLSFLKNHVFFLFLGKNLANEWMFLSEDGGIDNKNKEGGRNKREKTQIFINGTYFKSVSGALEFQSN